MRPAGRAARSGVRIVILLRLSLTYVPEFERMARWRTGSRAFSRMAVVSWLAAASASAPLPASASRPAESASTWPARCRRCSGCEGDAPSSRPRPPAPDGEHSSQSKNMARIYLEHHLAYGSTNIFVSSVTSLVTSPSYSLDHEANTTAQLRRSSDDDRPRRAATRCGATARTTAASHASLARGGSARLSASRDDAGSARDPIAALGSLRPRDAALTCRGQRARWLSGRALHADDGPRPLDRRGY